MTTGQKIYECRRKAGMTQEELADRLGVSRQAVSKWEADAAFPETEKILELCKMFSVSADELLFGQAHAQAAEQTEQAEISEPKETGSGTPSGMGVEWGRIEHPDEPYRYEYISRARLFGLPVLHVNLGLGFYRAKGIFAVGTLATGLVSWGLLSIGLLAAGLLSIGLLAFGALAFGLGVGAGGVATGALAFGGVAVGIMAFGGCSIGYIAVGGFSLGQYAMGGVAQGFIAVGGQSASGTHAFKVPEMLAELDAFLDANAGVYPSAFIKSVARSLGAGA